MRQDNGIVEGSLALAQCVFVWFMFLNNNLVSGKCTVLLENPRGNPIVQDQNSLMAITSRIVDPSQQVPAVITDNSKMKCAFVSNIFLVICFSTLGSTQWLNSLVILSKIQLYECGDWCFRRWFWHIQHATWHSYQACSFSSSGKNWWRTFLLVCQCQSCQARSVSNMCFYSEKLFKLILSCFVRLEKYFRSKTKYCLRPQELWKGWYNSGWKSIWFEQLNSSRSTAWVQEFISNGTCKSFPKQKLQQR